MNILLTAAPANSSQGILMIVVYMAVIFGFMYFVMIRPQKKEKEKMQNMLSTLEVGDSVLTTSGFYGIVIDISDEDTVIVEFGNNKNCRIPMRKEAISQIEKPEAPAEAQKKE
ncbi:MAG: preprotein translocase subunit YajC [Lachnospiraceae bacterium]|nr:preprotein translocase subunit YajC [Lachnospiraceae bacterium]